MENPIENPKSEQPIEKTVNSQSERSNKLLLKLAIGCIHIIATPILFLIGSIFFALASANKFLIEVGAPSIYTQQTPFTQNIILGICFYILAIGSLYIIYKRRLILYQWLTNSLFLVLGILFICIFFFSGWFTYYNFTLIAPQLCTTLTNFTYKPSSVAKLLCTIIFDDETLGRNHKYTENEKKNGLPVKYQIISEDKGYPICKIQDLKTDISYTQSGIFLETISLTNNSTTPCIFQKIDIGLLEQDSKIVNQEMKEDVYQDLCPPGWLKGKCTEGSYFILPAGKAAKAAIMWSNWCSKKPGFIERKLVSRSEKYTKAVFDTNTIPAKDQPPCYYPSMPTIVTITNFYKQND